MFSIFNFFVADDNPMKSSIIIALDHPLNSADGYLRERRKISQKYSIPGEGRQIVILTKQLLQSNLVRLTIVPSNYPINAIAIVKCEVCQGFNYRSRMLCGCSLNHMCCAHHLMPYDRLVDIKINFVPNHYVFHFSAKLGKQRLKKQGQCILLLRTQ